MDGLPLILLVYAVSGMLSGACANWASDALPVERKASGNPAVNVVRGPLAILHYLTLPWYFFRGGACPHCDPQSGERRPLRAPLLELAMMAAFVLIGWRFGSEPLRMVTLWLYAWFLLTVLVIDLEHRRVLNVMVAPAAVVALAASFLPGSPAPLDALLGGAGAFAAFFLIALLGRGAMGMGDVKLAGVIGLMTGYPLVVPSLLAGIVLGGLAAAVMLITRRATRKTAIAYAPYLCVGALAMLLWAG